MNDMVKPKLYRQLIDTLVDNCHNGQGQIGPLRVKSGVWNPNQPKDLDAYQNDLNKLLIRLSNSDRQLLARLLEETFQAGVFDALKTLEEYEIEPFKEGYEGSPYHDFIGRLDHNDKWEWPEE